MFNTCEHLKNRVCTYWNCPVAPEICEFCIAIKGTTEGFAQMAQSIQPFVSGIPICKEPEPYTSDKIAIILRTCSECPYSTREDIKATDIKKLPWHLQKLEVAKKFVAYVGNFLRRNKLYGLSCKLCGCSCRAKAVLVVYRMYSGGCLDIDPVTKLSRWEAALKKELKK